ncbi:unnamed protein product [Peniophora sp. CBMAI 1063]|nr:unnamed protein product [Peniophora sp. CBMAI 1063]
MSNPVRTPKSGDDWTPADLQAYNITIRPESSQTFFGLPPSSLPPTSVDEEVLTLQDARAATTSDNTQLVYHMLTASQPAPSNGASAVIDFARELLRSLRYGSRNSPGTLPRSRVDIPFCVRGERRDMNTDMCLYEHDLDEFVLLVQVDRRFSEKESVRSGVPELLAHAIGAFDYNNQMRLKAGRPTLDSKVMPGIVLRGASPTFFKIPVTADLVRHVQRCERPSQETVVSAHTPLVPLPDEGMVAPDNRRIVFRCFEAFRSCIMDD